MCMCVFVWLEITEIDFLVLEMPQQVKKSACDA